MIKIIEIPISSVKDICDKACIELRNEVYYIAYESDVNKPMSVLWADLDFIRKNFGVDKLSGKPNTYSDVTEESLNFSRSHVVEEMKLAIKHNVYVEAIKHLKDDGSFGTIPNPNFRNFDTTTGSIDMRVEIDYIPTKLPKSMCETYIKDIEKGLYVVCKYV